MRSREHRKPISPVLPGLLVSALVAGALLLRDPGALGDRFREITGQQERLGARVEVEDGPGVYRFFRTQGRGAPVTWSPCKPIRYVVNPDGAPAGWEQVVAESIGEIEDASGFRFEYDGETTDRDFDRRGVLTQARPVLVAWSDEDELPALAGDVAGLGGSAWVQRDVGREWFTTGMVALDTEVYDRLADEHDRSTMRAILTHELGHVVGLDHVEDHRELMYGDDLRRTTLGAGDRKGLALLGSVDC